MNFYVSRLPARYQTRIDEKLTGSCVQAYIQELQSLTVSEFRACHPPIPCCEHRLSFASRHVRQTARHPTVKAAPWTAAGLVPTAALGLAGYTALPPSFGMDDGGPPKDEAGSPTSDIKLTRRARVNIALQEQLQELSRKADVVLAEQKKVLEESRQKLASIQDSGRGWSQDSAEACMKTVAQATAAIEATKASFVAQEQKIRAQMWVEYTSAGSEAKAELRSLGKQLSKAILQVFVGNGPADKAEPEKPSDCKPWEKFVDDASPLLVPPLSLRQLLNSSFMSDVDERRHGKRFTISVSQLLLSFCYPLARR